MDIAQYKKTFEVEEGFFWHKSLRALVMGELDRRLRGTGRVLDAGCGTGKLLETMRDRGYKTVGVDYSDEALFFARQRGLTKIVRGDINMNPFADEAFDAIVSLDVLYHKGVDEGRALCEFNRMLAAGGILIMNLPAYEFLRSGHDAVAHTQRRYTAARVRRLLTEAGFETELLTYRVHFLFPIALVKRLFGRVTGGGGSDVRPLPRPVNLLFTLALQAENSLIRMGLRLPFGLSVFCIAKKSRSFTSTASNKTKKTASMKRR